MSISCIVPVISLNVLLPSSILVTSPSHLSNLDLITQTILGERYNNEVSHFGAFSAPHSHPSLVRLPAPTYYLKLQ